MNKFWETVVIIVIFFIILAFYWTRFQTVTANYAYAPAFYKIDRLTGDVTLTVGKEYVNVERINPGKMAESGAKMAPIQKPAAPSTAQPPAAEK
jgi:hypothetical protein